MQSLVTMWLSLPLVEWYLYSFIILYMVLIKPFHSLGRWFNIFLYVGYVLSTWDFIYYLHETINNCSQSLGRTGDEYFHKSFTPFYFSKPLTAAFKDPGLLNTEESILLLSYLVGRLALVYISFRSAKEITGKFFQRSENDEWHGRWEKIGQVLKEYSAPVVWKFTPEQIQDPVKVAEYLKEKRCGGSREEQLTALCWALATLYRTLLDTSQSPQGEEEVEEEEESRPTGTQTAAASEEQPMLGAVAPEQNTSNTRLVSLVRDKEETESSEEEEDEEAEPQITSNSRRKLQQIRECFTRLSHTSLLLWLYSCWCKGANTDIFLDGNEARLLGSLSGDAAIDRNIGRSPGTVSLWKRLVWSVKREYMADELLVYRDRWNTMLEGIEYLTELTMAEILSGNPRANEFVDDPDRAYCSWRTWVAFTNSMPPHYTEAMSAITWHSNLRVLEIKTYMLDFMMTPFSLPQHSSSYVEAQPKERAASGDDPCTICHEELGRNPCELECGHEFHRECIRTWVQEHSSTCPICRGVVVLPAETPERRAWNGSKGYKAKPWRRLVF